MVGTTLITEHSDDVPEDEIPEYSETDMIEEEDIGEIAFDIATEAVDEITKVKKRFKNQIGKLKEEKDKIIKEVSFSPG